MLYGVRDGLSAAASSRMVTESYLISVTALLVSLFQHFARLAERPANLVFFLSRNLLRS